MLLNTAASWFRKKSWRNERPASVLPEETYHHDHADRPTIIGALAKLRLLLGDTVVPHTLGATHD